MLCVKQDSQEVLKDQPICLIAPVPEKAITAKQLALQYDKGQQKVIQKDMLPNCRKLFRRMLGNNYQTTAFKLGLVHVDELVLVEAAVDYKVEEGDGSHEGLYQAED